MKKSFRILLLSFLLLTIASLATCHFGVQHEINKIPFEVRSKMTDFDWVGVEWITLGMFIQIAAFICLALAISLYIFQQMKNTHSKTK